MNRRKIELGYRMTDGAWVSCAIVLSDDIEAKQDLMTLQSTRDEINRTFRGVVAEVRVI